jgi:EAL domain-containing protein (putative c-di-GMP-specific phosphodiesterase class I)
MENTSLSPFLTLLGVVYCITLSQLIATLWVDIGIETSIYLGLGVHESNTKIVKAIIALANSFGLTVIAEGVETQAVKQAVNHLGADAYQGYYMSKPLPKEHFISFITTH